MTDWISCCEAVLAVILAGAAIVALAWVIQQVFAGSPGSRTAPQEEEEPDWLEAILLLELLDDEDSDGDDFGEDEFDSDGLDDDDFDDNFDDDYGYGYGFESRITRMAELHERCSVTSNFQFLTSNLQLPAKFVPFVPSRHSCLCDSFARNRILGYGG